MILSFDGVHPEQSRRIPYTIAKANDLQEQRA